MLAAPKPVVLLVEDDDDDVYICRTALAHCSLNLDVHFVSSVIEAQGWITGDAPFDDRTVYPVPDIIVTDLRTPKHSGLDFLRWARSRPELDEVPVIIHSGSYRPGQVEECIECGATAAVEKDSRCRQLIDAITHTLAGVSND